MLQSIAYDTNGNGVYDPGTDVILAAGMPTPAIAPDNALTVFVLTTLPGTATDGQTGQVRLTATSTTGSGTPGTVFADQGNGGGEAVVGDDLAANPAYAAGTAAGLSVTNTVTVNYQVGGVSQPPAPSFMR